MERERDQMAGVAVTIKSRVRFQKRKKTAGGLLPSFSVLHVIFTSRMTCYGSFNDYIVFHQIKYLRFEEPFQLFQVNRL